VLISEVLLGSNFSTSIRATAVGDKGNGRRGALAGNGLNLQGAAQILDDGFGNGQAQARALVWIFGRKKRVEHLGQNLWEEILELQRNGERLPCQTLVRATALGDSFFVGHSPAADGAVNIYLTEAELGE